jgi:hypothetical protein
VSDSRADWIVLLPLTVRIGEIKINVPMSVLILTDKQFVIKLKTSVVRARDYEPVVLDDRIIDYVFPFGASRHLVGEEFLQSLLGRLRVNLQSDPSTFRLKQLVSPLLCTIRVTLRYSFLVRNVPQIRGILDGITDSIVDVRFPFRCVDRSRDSHQDE